VFPPVLVMAYMFSKSVPKSLTQSEDDEFNGRNKKRTFCNPLLPYWCVYLAWLLVALSIVVSAFFTILYSFEWGREKSTSWLTAFLLSFAESVILIQPVKVCKNSFYFPDRFI